ncbi:UPF0183-domain-containing protein [Ascodesmis nigricans]|uniref:UPF0183-domain-containing protein n=1 Tax=Ascodesmis nigricans TaxID=341454 RepID=A0A4S2MPI2_9PEZI|nr:UPF0183-domain-containing protein [Ascodesmis nigricans]
MSTPPPAPVLPGKGLGLIPLGASLHHVLSVVTEHSSLFTSISTVYDPGDACVTVPILIILDNNGIRLRFDGPDQRLRLIEILDFAKCRPTYQSGELTSARQANPSFKNIYKLFGPTTAGEYMSGESLYILNYPGVSFTFAVDNWRDDVDFASQLASGSATSMAIFSGNSWAEVRDDLFTRSVTAPRFPANTAAAARSSSANDEIELVTIRGEGTVIELTRRYNPPLIITLNSTTPQDLITELGPPASIYRKSDHRLNIHRALGGSSGDESDPDDRASEDDDDAADPTAAEHGECFFNYFQHGFDILVSSQRSARRPVVTKMIIHGNVPGSYEFQRYRRCRWVVDLPEKSPTVGSTTGAAALRIDSEENFTSVREKLKERFGEAGKPMPYSRGNDSPSSSVEFLGGWEDGEGGAREKTEGVTFGNTELYGFPGMVFEVLKNGTVTCLAAF